MHGAIFGLYFGSRRSAREICTQIGPKKAEWRVDRGGDKGNVMMATSVMQVRRVRCCKGWGELTPKTPRGPQIDIMYSV